MAKKSNYGGYLIKVGDWKIPLKWMSANTYKPFNSGQDLDSTRDTDGMLHRTALKNTIIKTEFEIPPMKTDEDYAEFFGKLEQQYIDKVEKSCIVTAWIPELNKYVTQKCYVPDITPTLYFADDNVIKYNSTRIAFIGYGGRAR